MSASLPDGDERFLTVFETAAILRVSKSTVYDLVRSGKLKSVKEGRSFRIPESALLPALAIGEKNRLLPEGP